MILQVKGLNMMKESEASIGQVKREISELVNRVAFGEERIVLTSRGRPKAVLISLRDYEQIQQLETGQQRTRWGAWQQSQAQLAAKILAERHSELIDVDAVLDEAQQERDNRHDDLLDR